MRRSRTRTRSRRGGQTANNNMYPQTSNVAQGALGNAGDALGNAGTAVVDQTKKAGNWLSGLFSSTNQAGGGSHRKRSRGKGFLGMFNIFSRKRSRSQGRSRRGGMNPKMGAPATAIGAPATAIGAPAHRIGAPATAIGAPANAIGGGRRSRRGGSTPQPYSSDIWTAPGAFPSAVGGTKRRRKHRKH